MQDFIAQNSFARGEVEESMANINDAIEVFKVLKDTYNIAQSIKALGGRYSSLKEYDKALSLGEEALQLFRRLGDEVEVLRTQNTIASIYLDAEHWYVNLTLFYQKTGIVNLLIDLAYPITGFTAPIRPTFVTK